MCLGEMFKTISEQNFSMRSAEVELPASISALDPLEMSDVLVVNSNIFHIHQFAVKWKCWNDNDSVKTHLSDFHRLGRLVLCFKC